MRERETEMKGWRKRGREWESEGEKEQERRSGRQEQLPELSNLSESEGARVPAGPGS